MVNLENKWLGVPQEVIDLAGDDNLEEEEEGVELAGEENPGGVINVLEEEEEQGVRVRFGFSTRWTNNSAPSFDFLSPGTLPHCDRFPSAETQGSPCLPLTPLWKNFLYLLL